MLLRSGDLHRILTHLFEPLGPTQAELATSALLESELAGHPQFGLALLHDVSAAAIERAAGSAVRIEAPGGASATLDGSDAFGPAVAARAAVAAEQIAERHGTAAVAIKNLGRLGRLAPYVRWLADRGYIALMAANSIASVAPAGGHAAVLGTNPIAAAMPIEGSRSLVVDTATSATTLAALATARGTKTPLADNSALDADGHLTTDAEMAEALLPRAGSFGSSIGLIVEILTSGIAGIPSGPTRRRSGVLMAFRAADSAPTLGIELANTWQEAGGYLPGSRAPLDAASSPQKIAVEPTTVAVLDTLLPQWRLLLSGNEDIDPGE